MSNEPLDLLKRAIQYREGGCYDKAKVYLDKLIDSEPENHLLWYEKSRLPIVQQDNITIKNRLVSLSIYQQLPLPEKNNYLQQCGFDISELPEIESYLRVPNIVANQRETYLKMAIKYAPEKEKAAYTAELTAIVKESAEKKRKDVTAAVSVGVTALILAAVSVLFINIFLGTPVYQTLFNAVIVLFIPYAVSVTGMVLYTRAKNNGNPTALGLVSNLIALIISNLSIINAIVLFATK